MNPKLKLSRPMTHRITPPMIHRKTLISRFLRRLDYRSQISQSREDRRVSKPSRADRLKVEECKTYLRRYGLRLSGSREILIQRIKVHNDIINGGGEKKYPASSFVLNCKGDACMGDVVMFKQKVYKKSGTSRSVKVGPCGTRVVAGRIVTESYGAAKQQHTFTIEVLWSRGEKLLRPLRPLLIKGRNLYRLRTMRQKWEDEGERQKILLEKHARGSAARLKRKMERETRSTRNGKQNEKNRGRLRFVDLKPENPINQPSKHQQPYYYSSAGSQSAHVYSSNRPACESHNEQRANDFTVRSPILGLPLMGFPNSNFRGGNSMLGPTWVRYSERNWNFRTVQSRSPIRGHAPTVFSNSNHQGSSSMRSPLRNVHPYSQQRNWPNSNSARHPPFQ
ncbi:hypothetical protein ACS0TY_000972 [Phlomoides rotata]